MLRLMCVRTDRDDLSAEFMIGAAKRQPANLNAVLRRGTCDLQQLAESVGQQIPG